MAEIKYIGVSKHFGSLEALHDLNLTVRDKEFVSLVGPSGCGKSTTLNITAGLEDPSSGELYIDDTMVNAMPSGERDIAMVFQSYALYPHKTVSQNIGFGLKVRGTKKDEIKRQVETVAEALDIAHLLDRKPGVLSGGQRQRVALGRAMVRKPKVFLLDEPLSNLDAKLRVQMRAELKLLFERVQGTVVYVTHDQAEAMTMSDRVVVMNHGVVQQVGTPLEVYNFPINEFVAGFLGSPPMNFLNVDISQEGNTIATHFGGTQWQTDTSDDHVPERITSNRSRLTGAASIGIRPEDITIIPQAGSESVSGKVALVEPMGSMNVILVFVGDEKITLTTAPDLSVTAGESVSIRLNPAKIHFFDQQTGENLTL